MKANIKRCIEQCETCQRNKYEATEPAGVLQPIPIPKRILPKAGGMNVIMVIVDRLSKYAYFITLKHPFSAKQVAAKFIDKVVRKHGFLSLSSLIETIFSLAIFGRNYLLLWGLYLREARHSTHKQMDKQKGSTSA